MRRFAKPLSREQARQQTQPYVPKRTQQSNNWALGVFKLWVASRNKETTLESAAQCPTDLLEAPYSPRVLDSWLSLFVLEVRGWGLLSSRYCPKPVGPRVYKANQGALVHSFMNKSEREKYFPKLHNALDRQLRMLRSCGIGVERAVVTPELKKQLWSLGVLGMSSPLSLLNAVYNGKSFALRGAS